MDLVACPFCHEEDFDLIGLKNHLLSGHCAAFEEIPRLAARSWLLPPTPGAPNG